MAANLAAEFFWNSEASVGVEYDKDRAAAPGAWAAEAGKITEGAFVAFRSDWSKRWPDQDAMRNLDENGVQQSPGWSHEALEFLIHERHVKAVGHETFDTDAGIPAAEHGLVNEYYLLEQDIYQVEVLNQLDQVPAVGALISIAFPHWDKATGSPVRAVAILP